MPPTASRGKGLMQTTDTSITFDPATNTYRLHHDWRDDESVTTAVVTGISAITNTPPTDLDPAFETIDPDALNQLFDSPTRGAGRDDGWVAFELNECTVRAYANGDIEITPDGDDTLTATVPHTVRDR